MLAYLRPFRGIAAIVAAWVIMFVCGVVTATQAQPENALKSTYSYDANGNITKLVRYNEYGQRIDSLLYTYDKLKPNRLIQVKDTQTTSKWYKSDFEGTHLYEFNIIGQLIYDVAEGIHLYWDVYRNIREIRPHPGSGKPHVKYYYDAAGFRVRKLVITGGTINPVTFLREGNTHTVSTYYIRDAQGNDLVHYEREIIDTLSNPTRYVISLRQTEIMIYGAERIGVYRPKGRHWLDTSENPNKAVGAPPAKPFREQTHFSATLGQKDYEVKDHLGNVRVVVGDELSLSKEGIQKQGDSLQYTLNATVRSYNSYHPFGKQPTEADSVYLCSRVIDSSRFTGEDYMWHVHAQTEALFVTPGYMQVPIGMGGLEKSVYLHAGITYKMVLGYDEKQPRFRVFYSTEPIALPVNEDLTFTPVQPGWHLLNLLEDGSQPMRLKYATLRQLEQLLPKVVNVNGTQVELNPYGQMYRYGFNGKELRAEIANYYDYGYRTHNVDIGRFITPDPLAKKYPMLSPYQFASNSPIAKVDLDGLEGMYYVINLNSENPKLQ